MTLQKELELYGCNVTAEEFREILIDLHHAIAPSLNAEQLLYNPTEVGTRFVKAVRHRAKCQGLSEEFILRSSQNIRKAGRKK